MPYPKRRKRRLGRVGLLVGIVVLALLAVPPLLGKLGFGKPQDTLVLQLGSKQAIVNGELQSMTEGITTGAPYQEGERVYLPAEWTITQLTKHAKGTLPSEPATLSHDGMRYATLEDLTETYGWHGYFIEEAKGGLIFLDQSDKSTEPNDEQIGKALALLGPSRTQLLEGALLARADSDTVVAHGAEEDLKTADGKHYTPVLMQEGVLYLPVEGTAKAMGWTAQAGTDEITLTQGDQSATIAQGKVGKDANEAYRLYTNEKGTVYASAEAMAKAFSLSLATPAAGVAVMTATPLTDFADKLGDLAKRAEALPDKRPDIPEAKAYVALTFDDGPTGGKGGRTEKLLDELKARGVHATFFMCGYRLKDFHTHTSRYLAEGHQLGNHTMDHPGVLTKYTPEKVFAQFADNNAIIEQYCGGVPTVGRPVGGAYNDMVLEQMKKAGLSCINWSVDTMDWKYRDANRIRNVIVNQAQDGDIVLMHDLHEPTVQGVLAAIDELQPKGYAFVTVAELAQLKGIKLEPGKVYTELK